MDMNLAKIEQLNDKNYFIWSMKIEALLEAKQLYEDVIENDAPIKDDSRKETLTKYNEWNRKNKEALGIIILSLSNEQAILYRGIKCAKTIWESIKKRYEGAVEDSKLDLMIELTKIRKSNGENMDEYLTRIQGISRQLTELGKQITERELVRYIVEGLPEKYDSIAIALSTNRNISFIDLRQTLLHFEKKESEQKTETKAFRVTDRNRYTNRQKLCFTCNKPGHLERECWFRDKNKHFARHDIKQKIKVPNREFKKMSIHKDKKEHATFTEESCKVKEDLYNKSEHALTIRDAVIESEGADWILDSACSSHMTSKGNWLENTKKEEKFVNVAEEGRQITTVCRGEIKAYTEVDDEISYLRLKDVLYVPKLCGNLMSVPNIVKNGNEVILRKEGAYVYSEEGELICKGDFKNDMFVIKISQRIDEDTKNEECFQTNENSLKLWHRRLSHTNDNYIQMMQKKSMVRGLDKLDGKHEICEACEKGKMPRQPYKTTYSEMTTKPLEALHVDLCGPFKVESLGEKKYMMVVVDSYSRRYFVEFLTTKNEACKKLQNLINRRENELDAKVKRIRSDNGLEFLNKNLKEYFTNKGIKHEKTIHYSPRSNGLAERANRSLLDKARTLLIDSGLPLAFWSEAAATAEYVHNITPTKDREDKTPMELYYSRKPSVRHLKPFGCVAYYKVDNNKRHKLEPKAKRGIFIGYSRERKAYRIYDQEEEKIFETSDVTFNEEKNGYEQNIEENKPSYFELDYMNDQESLHEDKTINSNDEDEINSTNDEDEIVNNASEIEDQDNKPFDKENEENITSSTEAVDNKETNSKEGKEAKREKKLPKKFEDFHVYLTTSETPQTFEDAMKTEEKSKWKDAMDKEIKSMISHDVWKAVPRPKKAKVIKSKWIYKIKQDNCEEKFKARLVAAGYGQKQGIDFEENFSPVMKWDSFRILLALAAQKDSVIKHFDVNTAYLNSELNETVYMEQPPGYNNDSNKVYLLKKSIYGLPQSGRCWYFKFKEILEATGLHQSKADPCIYVKKKDKSYLYVGIYVDDFLVVANSDKTISNFIEILQKNIDLKETTNSNMFLSIEIKRKGNSIILSQKEYIRKILSKYQMENCKPVKTPGAIGEKLDDYEKTKTTSIKDYQEAIGSLLYLAVGTRPDIAFIVSNLSQYSKDPHEIHWIAVKRIIRYLNGTQDYCLIFEKSNEIVNITSDASWSTTHDAKSFGGYTIQYGKSTIAWKSNKQKLVALSTMEAELISACDAVTCGMWMKSLLEDLGEEPSIMNISTDSQALINWTKNPKVSVRTRHINRKYYFIKDELEKENFAMKYKNTKELESDIMTKNLSSEILFKHTTSLNLKECT